MAPEMLGGFMMCSTTRRQVRQFTHMIRRAEKKEAKRRAAERGKNVRPFVRLMSTGLLIRIGNDLEIYELEAVQRAEERIRQHEDQWDDFLYEEWFYGDESSYDDSDEDGICDNGASDYDFEDPWWYDDIN